MENDRKSKKTSNLVNFLLVVSVPAFVFFGRDLGIESQDLSLGLNMGAGSSVNRAAVVARERANFHTKITQAIEEYKAGRFVSEKDTVMVASRDTFDARVLTDEELIKLKNYAIKRWEDAVAEYYQTRVSDTAFKDSMGTVSQRKLSKFHQSKDKINHHYIKYNGYKKYQNKTGKGNVYKQQDR